MNTLKRAFLVLTALTVVTSLLVAACDSGTTE